MMGEIREKPQEKKIETMADEMADAKKEITVKGIYNADVGPGMSVAYALLCLPFWVNAMDHSSAVHCQGGWIKASYGMV